MDRILKICFCLMLIGINWIPVANSVCVGEEVEYGEKCQICKDDRNCSRCKDTIPNVECRYDNRCRCKEDYGIKGKGCVSATTIVEFRGDCNTDNNLLCNVADDNLLCVPASGPGKCVCAGAHLRNEDIGKCVRERGQIFDLCIAEPDTCYPPFHLKCDKSTNKCLMKKGYKYNCVTQGYEIGTGKFGEECDDDSCNIVNKACTPCNPELNLKCQNRECVCESEYYWDPSERKCLIYREYNESCTSIKCNPDSNLECNDDSVCDCKEGLFEYDEDEKRCVICVIEEEVIGVLIAILVAVYLGVVGEVGLIIWLVRRHRSVHPGDMEEGSSNQNDSKKKKDKKSKTLPEQIKKTGKSKEDPKIKIKP